MTIHLYSGLPANLVLLTTALWTVQASAQTTADAPSPPAYRSALEGYQPYTDEKVGDWKQANDKTGRIGGWREYAKEAGQAHTPDHSVKPDPGAAPAKPRKDQP